MDQHIIMASTSDQGSYPCTINCKCHSDQLYDANAYEAVADWFAMCHAVLPSDKEVLRMDVPA